MNELINYLINNDNLSVLKFHSPWLLFSNSISYGIQMYRKVNHWDSYITDQHTLSCRLDTLGLELNCSKY